MFHYLLKEKHTQQIQARLFLIARDLPEAMARAHPAHLRAAESLETDDAVLQHVEKSFLNPLTSTPEVMCAVVSSSLRTLRGVSNQRGVRTKIRGFKASVDGTTERPTSSEKRLKREVKHSQLLCMSQS